MSDYQEEKEGKSWRNNVKDAIKYSGYAFGIGLAAVGVLAVYRYKICEAHEVLVRTGLGIKDMSVTKQGMQWPLQRFIKISLNPRTYQFNLHNMSKGKVEFKLPVVFTFAPYTPTEDEDAFKRYARLLNDITEEEYINTISAVVEGETRGLTAGLSVEEMFSGKDKFKATVTDRIQEDLNKLGVKIINANIKEMGDYDKDNKYFEYRKQRAIETANYEAQVSVAEAKRMGEVGKKEKETQQRIEIAKLEQEAIIAENLRDQEISKSNAALAVVNAEMTQKSNVADVNSRMEVQKQSAIRERDVDIKRKEQQIENKRASELATASVHAEAIVVDASGRSEAIERLAKAELFKQLREAEGIYKKYEAEANGLQKIMDAGKANPSLAKFYMGMDKDLFEKLADANARAVHGMNPRINIWKTGSDADKNNPIDPILKTIQSFIPALHGLEQQGKINLPSFLNPKELDKVIPKDDDK